MPNEEDINEIIQRYELKIQALESEINAKNREIARDKDEIAWLRKITMTLAERPVNIINEAKSTAESKSMSDINEYNLQNSQLSGNVIGTNYGGEQIGTQHNYASQQNLAAAAKEIKDILQQLEQTYPTTTLVQQATVAQEAINQIENNPTLKQRVLGALKQGGIEAFTSAIDHPLVNILRAALEGWQEGIG